MSVNRREFPPDWCNGERQPSPTTADVALLHWQFVSIQH